MKKVILIPDSFKGTMSSGEICQILKSVIVEHYPDCEVVSIPVADGGEGSVDAFLDAVGGEKIYKEVTGPYPEEKVQGYYGILPGNIAVIEMAAAAALPMVGDRKDSKIILGLGGSATNDAACGLASACGISFYNAKGERFTPLGESMDEVVRIDTSTMDESLKKIEIVTMCDIDNPFYGPEGAPAIYGPQKGADEAMVKMLDDKMRVLAEIMKRDCGVDVQSIPGSGAAGGMGGGMAAYFKSRLQMGIETVLETVHFDELLDGTDFVYTGEGKIDGQSLRGKVVIGVARKAKKKGVKVIAIVGDIGDDIENAYSEGVTGIFSINRVAVPYKEAKVRAKSDLRLTLDNLLRYQKAITG